MHLEQLGSGQYTLSGVVNFENAATVEQEGREMFEEDLLKGQGIRISLAKLSKGDSSTLSMILSWIRLANAKESSLCISELPGELAALAKVCGIEPILQDSSCPA